MSQSTEHMAALIGSRICHDLISPIGAVANGLELMELSGTPRTPEMELVSESASHAAARIRLFRLVFGDATAEQSVAAAEICQILAACFSGARLRVNWAAAGDLPRIEVKLALLALMCAEDALGAGGQIDITHDGGVWMVQGSGVKLNCRPEHWDWLMRPDGTTPIGPDVVQFAILPTLIDGQGRVLAVDVSDQTVTLSF